jgi:hypothetical protein
LKKETAPKQNPFCSDLVCVNTFSQTATITLTGGETPVIVDGSFVSNTVIVSENLTCEVIDVVCDATVGSGCGDVVGTVVLLGLTLSGSLVYVSDLLIDGLCGTTGHESTQNVLTIVPGTLLCLRSLESGLTCAGFDFCPLITNTVAEITCPELPCADNSRFFRITTTFTFSCPLLEEK